MILNKRRSEIVYFVISDAAGFIVDAEIVVNFTLEQTGANELSNQIDDTMINL